MSLEKLWVGKLKKMIKAPEEELKINIELEVEDAELLTEALGHCYRLFGGNDRRFDEMLVDVSRKLSDENNIRETNIV